MKKYWQFYVLFLMLVLILSQSVRAENIHFNDDIYKLKTADTTLKSNVIENKYYKDKEDQNFWTSRITITYYPEVNNPVKYSNEIDKKIESDENSVLLKFVQNKKKEIALISYLENSVQQEKTFFVYNILKYEKHPKKGMMALKFSQKYVANSKDEILKMVQELKNINNDYMERMIISPIPPIVEK